MLTCHGCLGYYRKYMMERTKGFLNKLYENNLIKAIGINLVYFFSMLLFFEPFLGIDDYYMAERTYGAFSGEYDYHTTYMNFFYGKIVVFFQRLFPELPMYTIVFYVLVFVALTLLSYLLFLKCDSQIAIILINVVLIYLSWEGYVAIQFSKVAGIIGGIAAYALFNKNKSIGVKIVAGILFLFSCFIRNTVAIMIIGAWIVYVLLVIVFGLMERAIKWKSVLYNVLVIVVLIGIYSSTSYFPQYENEEDRAFWIEYWAYSEGRAAIQDYGYENFGEKKELFEEIGVSENDLHIWWSYNFDCDNLTPEVGDLVYSTQARSDSLLKRVFNIENIAGFFKDVVLKFFNIDAVIVSMVLLLVVFFSKPSLKQLYLLAVPYMIGILLNYYLYISGRYFQHRVDVGVWTTIILMILMGIDRELKVSHTSKKGMLLCVSLLFLTVPYQYWGDDKSIVSEVQAKNNELFWEHQSSDDEYSIVVKQRKTGTPTMDVHFDALTVMPKGYYKNAMTMYYHNYQKKILSERGIGNPYVEVLNNMSMNIVVSKGFNEEQQWEEYISKHTGETVTLTKIKEFYNVIMYRVTSKPLSELLELENVCTDNSNICADVQYSYQEGILKLDGYIFIEEMDDFKQEVYVEVVDKKGNAEYFFAQMHENKNFVKGTEGYHSKISASIKKNGVKKASVNLIVVNGDKIYRYPIK